MAYLFNGFMATKPVVRLINPSKKEYEVFFMYHRNGRVKPMRYKRGINSQPENKRRVMAEGVAAALWDAMRDGWDLGITRYPVASDTNVSDMTFEAALKYAADKKRQHLSKYSMYDYDGCVRFMSKAAKSAGLGGCEIADIDKKEIRAIISEAKEMNGWSNKARNKYLTILKSLLSVLRDDDIIKYNPAAWIKNEPEESTIGYTRITDEEKEKIAETLMASCYEYFEYLMFIYDDGVRRKEALLLQVKDINLQAREITIRPEVAKTNKERIIPITDTLFNILVRREVWALPGEYYLFSSEEFKPGEKPYHPNTPTSWWRRYVIEGLGINCKMYSLKHKGADDKILADVSIDALRNLYGHRSQQMTEVYARAIKGKYKQQIIDKAPAFAKVISIKKTG